MKTFFELREARATYCGRCGTTHVPPSQGGTCPALSKKEESVRSADKKPEQYTDPNTGKVKTRMVPVSRDIVKEKTLTPAEKKKREEIAKAMERENPGMDMSKKMAIATAAAKRVAEEVELDEVSMDLAKKVQKARSAKGDAWRNKAGIVSGTRDYSMDQANKNWDKADKTKDIIAKRMKKEAAELDEVSAELAKKTYQKRMDQAKSYSKQSADEPDMSKSFALARKGYGAEKKAGKTSSRIVKKTLKSFM